MASSSESSRNRTVTGRPPPANQVAAGHYAPAAATSDNGLAFLAAYNSLLRQLALLERLVVITAIVPLVASLLFTSFLAFSPRPPEFRVVSATVSQLNVTRSELTAAWLFNLHVKYPNEKLGVYYVEASVFLGDKLELARSQLPSRFQGWNYESIVQFQLGVTGEYVNDEVVKKISKGRDRGSLEFGVRALALARFTSGVWRTGEHIMRINCKPIQFGNFVLNGTGISLGHSEKCDVHLD